MSSTSMGRGIVLRQIDRLFGEGTLVGLGDGQLLERYRTRRDEAAFEALVDLHGPMVLGLCRRMLRDPRDIEDAFQATFLVLVRKAPVIRDGNLLSSWLYGVAYRVARRARSQTLRRRGHEASAAGLDLAARPESAERPGIDPVLDQELNRLPEKYRAPLILCYLRGRTHDQAAEELRCPVGTVRSRLARGRDLLRKRLMRRGFAPTAAVLGTGSSLPARLLVEAVPPSLVSATLKAALGFGSAQTIGAGAVAATALALAQGVLTTMKLAQLKWIGLAVLATTLSAGGVVAVSSAAYQAPSKTSSEESPAREQARLVLERARLSLQAAQINRDDAARDVEQARARLLAAQSQFDAALATRNEVENQFRALEGKGLEPPKRSGANPPEARTVMPPLSGPPPIGQTTMAHLSAERFNKLEQKVDQLLMRLGTNPPAATASPFADDNGVHDPFANQPPRSNPAPDRPDAFSRRSLPEGTNPTRALEVQLDRALAAFDRAERLVQNGAVTINTRDEARGKVLVIAAKLESLDEDIADEIARLKLELRRKNAERVKAEGQSEVAQTIPARNKRLNTRKPGMVADEDVAKAEGELKVATAQVGIVEAEIAEVGLRIQQLQRRQKRMKNVISMADRVKTAAPAK